MLFFIQCLDSLLSVLVKEMGPERKSMEAVQVAERFVRSVVRVFIICHTESVCVPSGSLVTTTSSSARRKRSVQATPLSKIIIMRKISLMVFHAIYCTAENFL